MNKIMAIAHTPHPTYGVQFHPESILTKRRYAIIENFLYYICKKENPPLHTEKKKLDCPSRPTRNALNLIFLKS